MSGDRTIQLANVICSDAALKLEIARLEAAIRSWAEQKDLWFDCGFASFLEHVDGEPGKPPIVTLLICGGDLVSVLDGEDPDGHEIHFRHLLAELGYFYENKNGYTMMIFPEDPQLSAAFTNYFHWQWVCSLIKEETADVYEELYHHFAKRLGDLNRMRWRGFEVLLTRVFQSQGFEVQLGSGQGDDGIDLRLWQRDPLGDVLTNKAQKEIFGHENAVTVGRVTVSSTDPGEVMHWWAHELEHQVQYHNWGIDEFAFQYVTACSRVGRDPLNSNLDGRRS